MIHGSTQSSQRKAISWNRSCCGQAAIREGHLALLKFLPVSLPSSFQAATYEQTLLLLYRSQTAACCNSTWQKARIRERGGIRAGCHLGVAPHAAQAPACRSVQATCICMFCCLLLAESNHHTQTHSHTHKHMLPCHALGPHRGCERGHARGRSGNTGSAQIQRDSTSICSRRCAQVQAACLQHHLERILPPGLTELADESESVRGTNLAT